MNFIFPLSAALLLPVSPLLFAQATVFKNNATSGHLVELYSSEGCSSCPPAEAWLNRLQNSPALWKDVFPVAFHVDYWDGLGWPDRFARAEFTQRQRDYAARLGQESVYTPEFIVNGREWRRSWLGSDALPPEDAAKSGELTLTVLNGGKFSASYAAPSAKPLVLNVALLGFRMIVDVKRGENGGRSLEHDFVVLGFSSTNLVPGGDGSFQAQVAPMKTSTGDPAGAVVAWISSPDGAVLQVTGGWLSKNLQAAR